jgi:hypothetical protein
MPLQFNANASQSYTTADGYKPFGSRPQQPENQQADASSQSASQEPVTLSLSADAQHNAVVRDEHDHQRHAFLDLAAMADAGLDEVAIHLNRMKALAVRMTQIFPLRHELARQVRIEAEHIERITSHTLFEGRPLLDGSSPLTRSLLEKTYCLPVAMLTRERWELDTRFETLGLLGAGGFTDSLETLWSPVTQESAALMTKQQVLAFIAALDRALSVIQNQQDPITQLVSDYDTSRYAEGKTPFKGVEESAIRNTLQAADQGRQLQSEILTRTAVSLKSHTYRLSQLTRVLLLN